MGIVARGEGEVLGARCWVLGVGRFTLTLALSHDGRGDKRIHHGGCRERRRESGESPNFVAWRCILLHFRYGSNPLSVSLPRRGRDFFIATRSLARFFEGGLFAFRAVDSLGGLVHGRVRGEVEGVAVVEGISHGL